MMSHGMAHTFGFKQLVVFVYTGVSPADIPVAAHFLLCDTESSTFGGRRYIDK